MEIVELIIDNPKVKTLIETKVVSTFQIQNGEKKYNCDPSIAVKSAHFSFSGYEAYKYQGFMKINVPDEMNILAKIVAFLHGNPLIIDSSTAPTYKLLAKALGMPNIEKYASIIARRHEKNE